MNGATRSDGWAADPLGQSEALIMFPVILAALLLAVTGVAAAIWWIVLTVRGVTASLVREGGWAVVSVIAAFALHVGTWWTLGVAIWRARILNAGTAAWAAVVLSAALVPAVGLSWFTPVLGVPILLVVFLFSLPLVVALRPRARRGVLR